MNIVKLYGGLANQLFQYAFGLHLKTLGKTVCYDISSFAKPQNPPRPYALDKFGTTVPISMSTGQTVFRDHEETLYRCEHALFNLKTDAYFFGYWQHPGYFTPVLDELKTQIRVRPAFWTEEFLRMRERIVVSNSIAVHVRRGDYLTKGHYLLPMEYYADAMALLDVNDRKVFVFSDDIPWCKENLPFPVDYYVEMEDYFCFDLIRLARMKIIANSTFGLFAAWLSSHQSVVAPNKWRENEEEQRRVSIGGLLKPNWITI